MTCTYKNYSVSHEISDPIDFCTQYAENALRETKATYEKKCFQGFYIEEVMSIVRLSTCAANPYRGGWATYDVEFQARVRTYDVVVKLRIVERGDALIGKSTSDPIVGNIQNPPEAIAVDDKVPVRLDIVKYPPMQDTVVAISSLFTCRRERICYRFTGHMPKVPPGHAHIVQYYMHVKAHLLESISQVAKSVPAEYLFFKQLFYSFAAPKALPGWATRRQDLFEPLEMSPGECIVRPLELETDSTMGYVVGSAPEGYVVVDVGNLGTIQATLLKELCEMLTMMTKCPIQYSDILKSGAQKNIWMLIQRYQQQ
jgi:hypothetical protein